MAAPRSAVDTRARLVVVARGLFAEHGYRGATIRAVAQAAGVDPALVYHYFDGKQGLLDAVLTPPDVAGELLAGILADERDRPTAFLDTLLHTWDTDVEVRRHMVALVRTGLSDERAALLLDGILRQMAGAAFGDVMADDQRDLRTSLVASQVAGLVLRRYVVVDPLLAAEPREALVAVLAPLLQEVLTGPIPGWTPAGEAGPEQR